MHYFPQETVPNSCLRIVSYSFRVQKSHKFVNAFVILFEMHIYSKEPSPPQLLKYIILVILICTIAHVGLRFHP